MERRLTKYIKTMRLFMVLALSALILSSCGGSGATEADSADNTEEVGMHANQTHVTAIQLKPQQFEHYFKVQGVVEAMHNAQIFPEVNGRITKIMVDEGQNVSKGQVIMQLDSKVISNQIEELESRLALAETVFQKQKSLWDQEIGSEIQFLEAKNNFESLKQNLETLQSQRAMYTITAPFAGVIDEIVPKEGEMASPAMPAVRLINMDGAYIKADVTEGYLSRIKEGDSVLVSFPTLEAKMATTISRIGGYINPNNRTFKIRLNLKPNKLNLKPNMLGELMIRDYLNDSVAVIPSSLVQMTPSGEEFVYVINKTDSNLVATKTKIKTGKSYESRTEVIEGLNGMELLVNKGARSIKEGEAIYISE